MHRSLKVGFISPYDHAFHGGVTSHINKLADKFRDWGHDVKIVAPCSSLQGITDPDFIPMGRPVPIPSGGSIARVSFSVWLRPFIKTVLQEQKFDVIHLHEPFAGFVPIGVLSLVNSVDAVTIGTFHTYQGTKLWGMGCNKLAMPLFRRLHGKIAVSNPAYQFINTHFPSDYNIIPNGINVDDFASADPFPELMDGKTNLLFLGRLEKRKGLKYALEAYSKLRWDWPDLRLVVVGAGKPDDDSFRIMSEHNLTDVVFAGNVSDYDVARYFKSAHIFCSPAIGKESFGIVLLEAMAAGVPVVATEIEGYASVVDHGLNGLLVPPKDAEQLADAIASLLRDPELRAQLSSNGALRADEFRWDRVARRVMDYYHQFLDEPKTALSQSLLS